LKGIAVGLTVLALGFLACAFVTGQIIESYVDVPFILQLPALPFVLCGLAGVTFIIDAVVIYKTATYKGY